MRWLRIALWFVLALQAATFFIAVGDGDALEAVSRAAFAISAAALLVHLHRKR